MHSTSIGEAYTVDMHHSTLVRGIHGGILHESKGSDQT